MSSHPYRRKRTRDVSARAEERAARREERVIAIALLVAGASAATTELVAGHTASLFTLGLLVFVAGAFVGLDNERRLRALEK